MQSKISWLDHDATARERSMRVLALFQERDTRDQLGLGSIRDNLADMLFPGTSTLQTRLRYMLFIPWVYQWVEDELACGRIDADRAAGRAAELEFRIVDALKEADDQAGMFGANAGRNLQRLPSSVYWAGLQAWGVRQLSFSQDQYHRRAPDFVERQKSAAAMVVEGDDAAVFNGTGMWHDGVPQVPQEFPDALELTPTAQEAAFIRDRVRECQPKSLLAHLFERCKPADCSYPWEHPEYASFDEQQQELLSHARNLAVIAEGAYLIYNLALAKLRERDDWVTDYEKRLDDWTEPAQYRNLLKVWDLDGMFSLVSAGFLNVPEGARRFLREWHRIVVANEFNGRKLLADPKAQDVVRNREELLKKGRSRFTNVRARDEWGGASGLGRYSYRWETVLRFHHDLNAALTTAETP